MFTSQVMFKPSALAARTNSTERALDMRQMCTRGAFLPKPRKSSNSVNKAMDSAAVGTPDKPKRDAYAPDAAKPPDKKLSCARNHTGKSKLAAYAKARCKTWVLRIGRSACESAIQPCSIKVAISANCSPFKPCVNAPRGWICAKPKDSD